MASQLPTVLAWKTVDPKDAQDQFLRRPAPRKALKGVSHAKPIGAVVNQISTRYKLTSPAGCSARELQQDLYEAARLLVREDRESLGKVCEWFSAQDAPLAACDAARDAEPVNRSPACSPADIAALGVLHQVTPEAD